MTGVELILQDGFSRSNILALQRAIIPLAEPMPEAQHFFAPGMVGRLWTSPPGECAVVGKIHRHGHLLAILKGSATIVDGFGKYEVQQGDVLVSRPGAKRAVYCHEQTSFLTVHLNPSDTQDLSVIEGEHIAPEDAETQALLREHNQGATPCLGSQSA